MNERPTPETDSIIEHHRTHWTGDYQTLAERLYDLARRLERERDEAREQLKNAKEIADKLCEMLTIFPK